MTPATFLVVAGVAVALAAAGLAVAILRGVDVFGSAGQAGVGQAQVHLLGPVPGDGLVRSQFVVLDAVVLGVLGEHDGVVDLVDEEPLMAQK